MNWLTRLIPSIGTLKTKSKVPDGMWTSCKNCGAVLYTPELENPYTFVQMRLSS
jgi:Acetyl-CoA carboxylase beta subunit